MQTLAREGAFLGFPLRGLRRRQRPEQRSETRRTRRCQPGTTFGAACAGSALVSCGCDEPTTTTSRRACIPRNFQILFGSRCMRCVSLTGSPALTARSFAEVPRGPLLDFKKLVFVCTPIWRGFCWYIPVSEARTRPSLSRTGYSAIFGTYLLSDDRLLEVPGGTQRLLGRCAVSGGGRLGALSSSSCSLKKRRPAPEKRSF